MGKKESGAAGRRRRREEAEADAGAGESPFDGEQGADRFAEFGQPDYDDPTTALTFARKYLMESLYQIGNDGSLKARDRHRLIKDVTMALGVTHDREAVESKFKKLRERREAPDLEVKAKADGISRPATARSYRADRGREPVPGPLPCAEASADEGDPALVGGRVGPPGSKIH